MDVIPMPLARPFSSSYGEDGVLALMSGVGVTAAALADRIARGLNLRQRGPNGETALHVAAMADWDEAVDGRMQMAINAGVPLEERADFRLRDPGYTALHVAADEGHLSKVECLLRNHADPNARTASGSTPLMMAVGAVSVEKVKALLCHGADLSIRDLKGATAGDQARGLLASLSGPQQQVRTRYSSRRQDELVRGLHDILALLATESG